MSGKYIRAKWPEDTAERIIEMRARGFTWYDIGDAFGVNFQTARAKALSLKVFTPAPVKRFTPEDDAVIRADYLASVCLKETAAKLGRSYAVISQRLYHHHKDILNTVRTARGTRALKRYGRLLLVHGATPDAAAQAMKERLLAAKAAARVAAIKAKENHLNQAINLMMADIANGKSRNAAIFEARAIGVTLERIASQFDLTRERVRQICDQEAMRLSIEDAA